MTEYNWRTSFRHKPKRSRYGSKKAVLPRNTYEWMQSIEMKQRNRINFRFPKDTLAAKLGTMSRLLLAGSGHIMQRNSSEAG
jgi:hypothetical protein